MLREMKLRVEKLKQKSPTSLNVVETLQKLVFTPFCICAAVAASSAGLGHTFLRSYHIEKGIFSSFHLAWSVYSKNLFLKKMTGSSG